MKYNVIVCIYKQLFFIIIVLPYVDVWGAQAYKNWDMTFYKLLNTPSTLLREMFNTGT